jgi:hypothetical protein
MPATVILYLSPPVPDRRPTSTKKLNAASKFRERDRTQPPAEDLDAVAVVTGQGREFPRLNPNQLDFGPVSSR